MGRKKKEINKDGIFQVRFRELWTQSRMTQEAVAISLGVSRPTVAGWLDGKNLPDIESLEKIARLFQVSADYLLGLSDTISLDANLKAAVEYTGLSERAVQRLHDGLEYSDYYDFGMSAEEKKEKLRTASALIEDGAFEAIITYLSKIVNLAYLEKAIVMLHTEHPEVEDPILCGSQKEVRAIAASDLVHSLEIDGLFSDVFEFNKAKAFVEASLERDLLEVLLDIREGCDHNQFLASKTFNGYLDDLVNEGHKRASRRYGSKTN